MQRDAVGHERGSLTNRLEMRLSPAHADPGRACVCVHSFVRSRTCVHVQADIRKEYH